MNRLIGFSTGVMFASMGPVSEAIFQIIHSIGCNHVEIHAHNEEHVDELSCNEEVLGAYVYERFKSRSVHLPAMAIDSDNALYFGRATSMFLSQDACIVIHPDFKHDFDEITTFFPRGVAVENMDNRKKAFRTLQDMRNLFVRHPELKFCFDVQHWIINDNPVSDIPKIIAEFGDRITCVHLSGIGRNKYHVPIYTVGQHDFIRALETLPPHLPIVLEGVCDNVESMWTEFSLVKHILT